jgi:hypothetical protein
MFASKLRSFDLYRKLPQDIIEPTFSGATISVISSILIAMLFLTEFLVKLVYLFEVIYFFIDLI